MNTLCPSPYSCFSFSVIFLAEIIEPFLRVTSSQGVLSVKTYFDEKVNTREGHSSLPSCDIMVTKGKTFLQVFKAGLMDLMSYNLIIFDECHLGSDVEHPFAILLKNIEGCKLDTQPKIVGISSEIHCHQACPQDLERFLNTLEELFHCKISISSDLLALNRYGERVEEEIVYYTCTPGNDQFTCTLKEILLKALAFLKDIPTHEASNESVVFVKHIFTECWKVLLLFGSVHTAYVAGIAFKEIRKLEKKCSENFDLLTLQFCRTQMNHIVRLTEQDKLGQPEGNVTDVTTKLLFHVSTHLKPKNAEEFSFQGTNSHEGLEVNLSSTTEQPRHAVETPPIFSCSQQLPKGQDVANLPTSQQTQTDCTGISQSSNLQSSYGAKTQCDDPLCIVLVPSTIIAKALNSLINKLSDNIPEYSFLKSVCVLGDKAKQGMIDQSLYGEMEGNVMECLQNGSANVLVTTFEVERELYARRCSLLIRLGMPKNYEHYLRVKKKLKSAGAKLVILVREEEKTVTEERFEVL